MKSWLFHLPIVDSVLEQMIGSVIHRQILQTSTEEACEDRVLLLCDGKIQLKHAPAAKMTSSPNSDDMVIVPYTVTSPVYLLNPLFEELGLEQSFYCQSKSSISCNPTIEQCTK